MTRALTPEQVVEAQAAFDGGESMASIARRLGCSKSNIQHHVKSERSSLYSCPQCGKEFYALPSRSRRTCGRECGIAYKRAEYEEHRRNLLVELEWLAGTDTWENIVRRLGYSSSKSLARQLSRMGEHTWAAKLERGKSEQERWGRAA